MSASRSVLAALAVAATLVACGGGADPMAGPAAALPSKRVLADTAEDSGSLSSLMRACIVQNLAQGLSPAMASRLCAIRATPWLEAGLSRPISPAVAAFAEGFDPASVQVACGAGNPQISEGFWSGYSTDQLKQELDYAKGQRDQAAAEGDRAAEAQWAQDVQEIWAELEERDAQQSQPVTEVNNLDDLDAGKRQGAGGACHQVSTQARETLLECSRVAWASGPCTVLAARLTGCPDPRLAYVDPAQGGLACQQAVDPEPVRKAWEQECESRTNGDVCGPKKTPDGAVVHPSDDPNDVCANPRAWVDGDTCVVQLPPPEVPRTSLDDLLLFAFKNFGGPVITLGGTKGPACPKCSGS